MFHHQKGISMRNTWQSAQFKEQDKTPEPVHEMPAGPPVPPELIAFRRSLGNLRLPLDPQREVQILRRAILDLAEVVYRQPTQQPTKGSK
jgi:hypothetical protein